MLDTPLLCGLVDLQVHLLFLYRVWLRKRTSNPFGHHDLIHSPTVSDKNKALIACLLVHFSGELTVDVLFTVQLHGIASNLQIMQYITTVKALLALIVVRDFTVALTLSFLLRRWKSDFRETNNLLKRTMTYAIGTGSIRGVWGIIGLIAVFAWPQSYVFILVLEVMPKREFSCFARVKHLYGIWLTRVFS